MYSVLRRARGGKRIKLLLGGLSFSSLPRTQNGSGLISSHQLEKLLDLIPVLHASGPGQLQVVGTSRGLLKSSSLLLSSPLPPPCARLHSFPSLLRSGNCTTILGFPAFFLSFFVHLIIFLPALFFSSQLAGPDGVGRGSPRGPCPNMIGGRKHQVVRNVV